MTTIAAGIRPSPDGRPQWAFFARSLGVLVALALGAAEVAAQPFEWRLAEGGSGHFYEYVNTPTPSWTAALEAAQSRTFRGAKGNLVTIRSAAENAFVASLRVKMGLSDMRAWIGLADDSHSGTDWQWQSNESTGYTNWAPGEPNNPGVERWVEFFASGLWNNNTETYAGNQGYVVEYIPSVSRCDKGTCYVLHFQQAALTATQAEQVCSTESGGHLASVHSLAENDLIGQMVDPLANGYTTARIGGVAPGGFKSGPNAVYAWTDGTPWDYNNWRPARPGVPQEPDGVGVPGSVVLYPNTTGPLAGWDDFAADAVYFQVRYFVCKYRLAPTPPTLALTRPGPSGTTVTTAERTITLRGRAADNTKVEKVTWENRAGSHVTTGTATGTDLGDPSWLIRRLPLSEGTNQIRVWAWDDEYTPSAPAEIDVLRLPETAVLKALRFNGVQVVTDGVQVVDSPVLSGPGNLEAEVDPRLPFRALHLLLNGEVIGSTTSGPLNATVDVTRFPADQGAPANQPFAYQLTAVLETATGQALPVRVRRGTLSSSSVPFRIDSPTVPVATEEAQSLWTVLPSFPSGPLRAAAVDASGQVWVVGGGALTVEPIDSTEVVGSEIRYVTELQAAATDSALWHWNGATWTRFTPGDLGAPSLIFTSVAADADAIWIGTTRGLLRARRDMAGGVPVIEEVLNGSNGLAGSWISALHLDAGGRLLVGHRGSRYYRLHPSAQKRYWLDSGGVSVRNGSAWTTYLSDKRDDGSWDGVAGFDVTSVAPAGPTGFWAGSEAGLSRFDGAWVYHDRTTGMTFDDVRAIAAATSDEIWAAGKDEANWLHDGTWARFVSTADTFPAGAIHALRLDASGRVFFATETGVASFDPFSRLWTRHPEAGLGPAGGLALAPTGRVWTAVSLGNDGRVAEFNPELGVGHLTPEDLTRLAADGAGLAAAALTWDDTGGAIGYEVFLNGAMVGRTAAPSSNLFLLPGSYAWTVRALLPGGLAGPRALPRSLRVDESRDLGDAEVLVLYRGTGNETRVADLFREPGAATWNTFTITPGFGPSNTGSAIDLSASANARLVSAKYESRASQPQQYPLPLDPTIAARPTGQPLRIAGTSESEGLGVLDAGNGVATLYNGLAGESGQVAGAGLMDVAGLSAGRVALIDRANATTALVRVLGRDEPRGDPGPLAQIAVEKGGSPLAIAGTPDGGFALLATVGATSSWEVDLYDGSLGRWSKVLVSGPAAVGDPLDLSVDEEGRIYLLTVGPSGPAVFVTREASPTWTQVPWSLPAGAANATAVATYVTPAPRPAVEAGPDNPPVVPGGTTTLPGTDVFVYAPGGFTSCKTNTGPLWILGFLRTNGSVDCDSPTAPTTLSGAGGLFLDYNPAGYGSAPAGAPTGGSARQLTSGTFSLNLRTGAITLSVPTPVSVPALGTATATRLNLLGMGEYASATQRKGIGLGDGRSTDTYGAFHQALTFSNLFLTDVGGVFHQTFGGIDGVLAPYDKGALRFSGVPLKLRTTGDLRSTSCAVNFDTVTAEVLSVSDATQFPLELAQLCVNPGAVTFGQTSMRFLDLFDFTIRGGSIESTGVGAGSATIQFPGKTFELTGFHAGTDGFRFDSAPGLDLAGIKAEMQQVSLHLPSGNDRGGFSAGLANLEVTNFAGRLDQLEVPFDFFSSPPARLPSAHGGLLRIGPEADPFFKVDIKPGLQVSSNGITIPAFSLITKTPSFSFDFAGGQINRQFVELNDAPPVNIPQFRTSLDFERIRLGQLSTGGQGFFTSKAEVTAGPVKVTLRDFSINTAGKIDISGGGFQKAGFGFDVARNPSAGNDLAFKASFSAAPIVQNARGDVRISDGNVSLTNFTFDQLTLGPLRVKNPLFGTDCPPPLPTAGSGRDLFFGATVGFGRFPDVTGRLCLNNGRFAFLGMEAQFPAPGYPLYGPIYLQRVAGSFNLPRQEMNAEALLSGGPQLSFPPFAPGPYYLVTLKGSITISGLGYFQTNAELRMLQGPPGCTGGPPACFGGFLVGQSTAIVGNVYLNNQFVGVGMYFKGNVVLFSGVLNVGLTAWVYPPLGGVLAPGPQQGTFGGNLNGTLQVPPYVPLIGGKTFGQAAVSLRGTFATPPAQSTASFTGTVSIPLCAPPLYYCTGVRWCQKCTDTFLGRICSPPYPCGATGCGWHQTACYPINVGFRIDGSGFHAASTQKAVFPGRAFQKGFTQKNGLTVLTNFRLQETRSPVTFASSVVGQAQSQTFVTVPEGVNQAIVRVDFSAFAGDANLTLRFPDGRVFTKDNTPDLNAANTSTPPQPGDPFVFYRHEIHTADPNDENDRGLKEAAFVFRGPFEIVKTPLTDAEGVPTGEVVETFGPTTVPAGAYEVTIDATADADRASVDLLLGNQPPRLTRSLLQPLGNDQYHLEWAVDDPDGDTVTVKLHVGTELLIPQFSQQIGAQDGYPAPGGVSSFDFDLRRPEFKDQGITAPLQVFVSLDDGFDEPQYIHLGSLAPVISEKAPPQVAGIVVRPRPGAVEVYWDPIVWTPPSPNLQLANYGVVVQEQGPAGTVGLPLATTVSQGTEALITGLNGGRTYRVTVSAVAHETLLAAGPPLCACNPKTPPAPGSTCDQPAVPCDTPTDLMVEHSGRASAAVVFVAPTGTTNSPPRFLSTAGGLALLGTAYSSPIRVEDPDGDPVDLQLCGCQTLNTEPPRSSCDAPLLTCDPPTPAGLAITGAGDQRSLTYLPTPAGLGRHTNALVARDGRGGEAVQQFSLEVAHYGQARPRATFTSDPPLTVLVGETFSYAAVITGLPAEIVPRFAVVQGPTGMQIDAATGLVTYVPSPGDLGNHDVVLEVLDGDAGCATCVGESLGTQAFTLQVLANPLGRLAPVLAVTPDRRMAAADTSVIEFEVANTGTGTFSWTATVDPAAPWLTISSGAAGTGPGVIHVAVAPNPTEMPRVGSLRVEATAATPPVLASPRDIRVEQAGARLAVLSVSPERYTTHDRQAAAFDLAIRNAGSGTLDWSASVVSGTDWLSLAGGFDENNGTGDGAVTVKLAANPAGVPRHGTVRIRSQRAQNSTIDVPVSQIPDLFTEEAAAAGLATLGAKPGGLVFCDLNDDGFPDAIVNTGDRDVRTRLYFNDGLGRFTDVTASHAAGLLEATAARSVICADLDGDGYPDFARNDRGRIEIYLNRGPRAHTPWSFGGPHQRPNQVIEGTPWFRRSGATDPIASASGADPAPAVGSQSTAPNGEGNWKDRDHGPREASLDALGMAWIDHDRDGDLDLLVDNGENGLVIFENDGHGHFGRASHEGLDDDRHAGGYLTVADYDADGDVDVLSRRRGLDHNLWQNRDGHFTANRSFEALATGHAGAAFCDVDADGDLDVVWAGRAGAEIWLNDHGRFIPTGEPGASSGVNLSGISLRGVACGDLDNDGDLDLVFSADSGPGYVFLNETPAGGASGLRFKEDNSGIELSPGAGSLALGDYDRDGDLDLLVNVDGGANQLWQSHVAESGGKNYLAVRARQCLIHDHSRDEIGATIRVFEADGITPVGPLQEVSGGSGIGSQGPATVHFGLPDGPDKSYVVEVRYLRRSIQHHHNGSSTTIVRKRVVPASLGEYQLLEVKDCTP